MFALGDMSKDNISSETTMQPRRRRVIERLVFGGIYLVLTLGTGFLEFRVLTAHRVCSFGRAALAYLSFYVTSSSLHSKYPGLTPQEVLKESIAFWIVGLMIAMEWYVPVVILKKLLIKRVFGKPVVNVHAD